MFNRSFESSSEFPVPKRFRSDNEFGLCNPLQQPLLFKARPNSVYHRRSICEVTVSNGPCSDYDIPAAYVVNSQLSVANFDMGYRGNNSASSVVNSSQSHARRDSRYYEYPYHVFDGTLPKELLSQFQTFFCKLCAFQFDRRRVGKLHYESKNHLKNVRNFLTEYAVETGQPLHPLAKIGAPINHSIKGNVLKKYPVEQYSRCEICKVDLNSIGQANEHYQGKNHLKAEAKLGIAPMEMEPEVADGTNQSKDGYKYEGLKDMGLPAQFGSKQQSNKFSCELCNVTVTCESQLIAHTDGQKHKKLQQAAKAGKSPQSSTIDFSCEVCNISLHSESEYQEHKESEEHQEKMETSGENDVSSDHDTKSDLKELGLPTEFVSKQNKWYCELCDIASSTAAQHVTHIDGQKHRKLEQAVDAIKGDKTKESNSATFTCKVCALSVNSEFQYREHIRSKKHEQKVEKNKPISEKQDRPAHCPPTSSQWMAKYTQIQESENVKELENHSNMNIHKPVEKSLYCDVCDVTLTSASQFDVHAKGYKHIRKLNQHGTQGKTNESNTITFTCKPCGLSVNSEFQYEQHMESKKHKQKLEKDKPLSEGYIRMQDRTAHCERVVQSSQWMTKYNVGIQEWNSVQQLEIQSNMDIYKPLEKSVFCDLCNVTMSSAAQFDLHVTGFKHIKKLHEREAQDVNISNPQSFSNTIDYEEVPNDNEDSLGLYYCHRCDVSATSEAHLKQHKAGKKHWSNMQKNSYF